MSTKTYRLVTGAIFAAIAVLHLSRVIYGWDAMIGSWAMPMWVSWIALAIAGYLAYGGLRKQR